MLTRTYRMLLKTLPQQSLLSARIQRTFQKTHFVAVAFRKLFYFDHLGSICNSQTMLFVWDFLKQLVSDMDIYA